jgi:hypothetical protein
VKEELIDKLCRGEISTRELDALMELIDKHDFRIIIKRIFDINEADVINHSSADKGIAGFLNRSGKRIKNRRFNRLKKKKSFRSNNKIILAEGDSWFEYPWFIRDVVDWILKLSPYPVYSLAFGGDWVANILYEGEYIDELSLYQPEIFLISGGGNDIVGEQRLAKLVHKRSQVNPEILPGDYPEIDKLKADGYTEKQSKRIVVGRKFMNKDFTALINLFRIMYSLLFQRIEMSGKFSDMKIITQGYDFAIPSNNRNPFLFLPRLLMSNGKWLYYPLLLKGITDREEQRSVISALIYEFNEMLIETGKARRQVYHIDSRGALAENEWADELHPKRKAFRRISQTFLECIKSTDPKKKVFRVCETVPG